MTCSEFEKQIMLFSELTTEEKAVVNNHVQQCESCGAFFESQSALTNVIGKAANVNPEPKDSLVLTRNIMARIKANERRGWKLFDLTSPSVSYGFARYAMAAVSVGLAIYLSMELFTPIQFENNTMQGTSHSIILNRKEFGEKLFHSKSMSNFSFASQCKSPFNITKVDTDCLRQKLGYQ